MLRSVAILALISSVSAFLTSVPSLAPSSRRVVTSPAAGSLKMTVDSVEERLSEKQKGGPYKTVFAPDITLFDNVGCARKNLEYKGKKSGTDDDERCVKVEMTPVSWSENSARTIFYNLLPLFNNAFVRAQVAERIMKLNTEAKAKGLPPNKWPFPPGYLVEAGKRGSVYDIVPGGQK